MEECGGYQVAPRSPLTFVFAFSHPLPSSSVMVVKARVIPIGAMSPFTATLLSTAFIAFPGNTLSEADRTRKDQGPETQRPVRSIVRERSGLTKEGTWGERRGAIEGRGGEGGGMEGVGWGSFRPMYWQAVSPMSMEAATES